jgi:hypothetical protein
VLFESDGAGDMVLDHAFIDEHAVGREAVQPMRPENSGLLLTRDRGT